MAIVKFPSRIHQTLEKAFAYITKHNKTDNGIYVSSYKCGVNSAAKDFALLRKSKSNNRGNVLAIHLVQSFTPNEITPEQAHQLGLEFLDKFLQGEYQYVMTTDIEKAHIHNHVIFNPVSITTGKKFRDSKIYKYSALTKARKISDDLCRKYGYYVIDNDYEVYLKKYKNKSKTWIQYDNSKLGLKYSSWRNQLKLAIDQAILQSENWDDFLQIMAQTYEVKYYKPNGGTYKHIAFKAKQQKRFTRADTIGSDYTIEKLQERISSSDKNILKEAVETELKDWKKQKNLEKELGYIIKTDTEKMHNSIGLQRWARLKNIQTVSELLLKLGEKGYNSIQDLNADISNKIEQQMSLISKTKEIEKEQEKLNETMELLHQYKIYKDYYEQSKTADKSYKSTYSAEIALYVAAVKQLKQMYKEEKIPSTAMILERLSCLDEMMSEISSEYKELSSSINELKLLQKNFNDYKKFEIENNLETKFSAKEKNGMEI